LEIWDAYTKDGRLAGCDLVRGEPIPEGLFHVVSEVFVRHTDGSYLVMQRDWKKVGYPGLFESGASGSILKGETPYEGAIRELREETGIQTDDLTYVFSCSDLSHTFYYSYFCVVNCEKSSICLQAGETISYRWLYRDEYLELMKTSTYVPTQRVRWEPYLTKI
jgi:8-oxo-dGTP diphosphatase